MLALEPHPNVFAGSDPAMEDILEGFEEEQPSGNNTTEQAEILEGFDDDTPQTSAREHATVQKKSTLSLDGYFKNSAACRIARKAQDTSEIERRGLSKLRTELQLELELDPAPDWDIFISGRGFYDFAYSIRGRSEFTPEVLDEYESELELKETYISGRITRNLDIKAGRQIVVWGKSDNIRVTDVLNPLDLREPGLTDIENLRLPVVMTRLDYYFGDFSLTGIGIHEIRFNKTPPFGSDFNPMTKSVPEDKPESIIENTEYALALSGIFSGWDMSLYWADIYDDNARLEAQASAGANTSIQTHHRIQMVGGALNVAVGNWLLKTEAAHFSGLEYFATDDETFSRTDLLAGIEYSGFDETTITLEAVNRHIHDYDSALEKSPDNTDADMFQWVVRYGRDFWNDTLTLTLLASNFGLRGEEGAFQRMTLEYDLTDALSVLGGVIFYQSGDNFRGVDDNDRLFFDLTYHF